MSDEAGGEFPANTLPSTNDSVALFSIGQHLAAELAAGFSDSLTLQKKYGISPAQWARMKSNPVFRAMVADAVRTWSGDMNAGQRITKKTEIILEDALPVLDRMVHDTTMLPSTRIEAIKELRALSGRNNKELLPGGGGGGFTLNINLGDRAKSVTIEGSAQSSSDE